MTGSVAVLDLVSSEGINPVNINLVNINPVDINSIDEMKTLFTAQREAYLSQPAWDLAQRKQRLKALKRALLDNKDALVKAVSEDYGHRSEYDTLYADILPTVAQIGYTLSQLRRWMKTSRRSPGLLLAPASIKVHYQPLGVVGIVVPWNFPIQLSLVPLITSIAAGNRTMIKLSEFTPHTNRVLREIISSALSETEAVVIEGEADIAAAFTALPFDHILFTGSTAVGKHVMRAAADNLTPVTLELGGKSPVVVAPDMAVKEAVNRIMFGKSVNSGQICVAPDYVLCPRGKIDEFIDEYRREFNRRFPDAMNNGDYTNIVDERQYQRLKTWLQDARDKGAQVTAMVDGVAMDDSRHRMMPHLLQGVSDEMTVMQQEIFGPLLPLIPYDSIDEAISYIKQRPHPLALYIMSFDKKTQQHIQQTTISGGVVINDTLMHVAADDAPFGGVGAAGMGHYHGVEGFRTLSKAKTVLRQGRFYSTKLIYPPYGTRLQKLILKLFLR